MITKLLPLLTLDSDDHALIIGSLCVQHGFRAVEVTFRTEAAPEIIKAMSSIEGLTVGAGTVSNIDQAKLAIKNGAEFIITPGINRAVIEYCLSEKIPVYPGVVTPSEIEVCRAYGLKILKLFPAGVFGGLDLIKAYYGPYRDIKFIPTGGVNRKNVTEFLLQPNVAAVGGSFILNHNLIEKQDWDSLSSELKEIGEQLYEYLSK